MSWMGGKFLIISNILENEEIIGICQACLSWCVADNICEENYGIHFMNS